MTQSDKRIDYPIEFSAVDFALLKDGKLIELNKEVDDNKFSVGDIFFAKVRKSVSGLNAAFVNVGHEKMVSYTIMTRAKTAFYVEIY